MRRKSLPGKVWPLAHCLCGGIRWSDDGVQPRLHQFLSSLFSTADLLKPVKQAAIELMNFSFSGFSDGSFTYTCSSVNRTATSQLCSGPPILPEQATSANNSPAFVDPTFKIPFLPVEIIMIILQQTTSSQDSRPPWNLAAIDRRWRETATQMPELWTILTLPCDNLGLSSPERIARQLEIAGDQPLTVKISGSNAESTKGVLANADFLKSAKRWKHVELLLPPRFLEDFLTDDLSPDVYSTLETLKLNVSNVTQYEVWEIMMHRVDYHPIFPALKELEMSIQEGELVGRFLDLLLEAPQLDSITLLLTKPIDPEMDEWDYEAAVIDTNMGIADSFIHGNIVDQSYNTPTLPLSPCLGAQLRRLTILRESMWIDEELATLFLGFCPNLEELKVGTTRRIVTSDGRPVPSIQEEFFYALCPGWRSYQSRDGSGSEQDGIDTILPRLRVLSLEMHGNWGVDALRILVASRRQLESSQNCGRLCLNVQQFL
jgi:hypothetical protein